ncbi:MAG: DUF6152 family protein [Pseudomonadota bacterium]
MEIKKKSKRLFSIALFSALFVNSTAWAHHSLVGEFDTSVNFELRGAITKVEWTNPHIWIYLDVTAESGAVEKWECEMGSPNQLIRQGSKKEDLPVGTVIRAQANPARVGEHICSTRRITLDDGSPVFTRAGNQ